jgi:ParB family chromosome partitioning protein
MKRIALGRGLESLIPVADSEVGGSVAEIEVSRISTNRYQPRKHFDEEKLKELAESIRQKGFIQPVVVRRSENDAFELIVGERRLRAAQYLMLEKIPAIIHDEITKLEVIEMTLIENIQRENLNPLEEAEAYRMLLQECGLSQEDLAGQVGKNRSSIANSLRLLTLPERIKQLVIDGKLSAGAARVILAIPGEKEKLEIAEKTIKKGLSVRELERMVYGESKNRSNRRLIVKSPHLLSIEDKLKGRLQTKVYITPRKKGGRIVIEYYNTEGLTRILEELKVTENL